MLQIHLSETSLHSVHGICGNQYVTAFAAHHVAFVMRGNLHDEVALAAFEILLCLTVRG